MGKIRISVLSSALLLGLLAGGCTFDRLGPAAPVTHMGTRTSPFGTMLVLKGDTLATLASRYRLSAQDIISANRLSPPYNLTPGARLALPYQLSYTVQPQDTLYNIARMFNIAPVDLAAYNSLNAPYALNVGQVLRIPGVRRDEGFTTFTIEEAPSLPAHKAEPVEVEPLTRRKTPADQKVFASNVAPAAVQELPVAEALSAMIKSVAAGEIVDARPVDMPKAAAATTSAPKTSATLSKAAMAKAPPAMPARALQTTMTPAAKAGYVWPVRGRVISSYGPKTGNLFNDGINIAAPRGTPVQAAADGIVAYVGSDLASYGNLVLIRHGNGVMTAYAHMQNTIVKKGETVKMGRVIGAVGSSGSVTNSQLHFEIRQGRKSIDPGPYLGVSS